MSKVVYYICIYIALRCIFYVFFYNVHTSIGALFVAPSQPINISLTTNSSDCVILKWEEPVFSNGEIESYQVGDSHLETFDNIVNFNRLLLVQFALQLELDGLCWAPV